MYNKNKFKNISTIFVIVFFASLIGLSIWQNFYWPKADLYLKGERLTVLVANNDGHRFQGLGGRDSLGGYDGMLFIYGFKDRLGVVMRDMRFPISVVWFDDGEVVDIAPILQIEPGVSEGNLRVYRPRVEANVFLELPTGWVESHGLKIGDKLEVIE